MLYMNTEMITACCYVADSHPIISQNPFSVPDHFLFLWVSINFRYFCHLASSHSFILFWTSGTSWVRVAILYDEQDKTCFPSGIKLYKTNNDSWENLQRLQMKKIYTMVIKGVAFSDTIILWEAKRFILLDLLRSTWCRELHGAYRQ